MTGLKSDATSKSLPKTAFDHYTQVGCCIYLFRLLTYILAQKQTATVCSGSTLFAYDASKTFSIRQKQTAYVVIDKQIKLKQF